MEQYIKVDKENQLGTITFYSELHNAMSNSMLAELTGAIQSLSADEEVKVILLRSIGSKVFCAGASFKELQAITNQEEAEHFFRGFANVINAIRKSTKIVVGRVQGKAVGGGVGLAAAADYTFAHKEASIRLSELMIGMGPYVIGPAVERKIGAASFQKMCLSPDMARTAEWATEQGLYQESFDTIELMDVRLEEYISKLCTYPSASLAGIKKMYSEGTEHWDQLLEDRVQTVSKLLLTKETQAIIQGL
jgi:methylglutaconyl-CoA hydratase